MSNVTVVGNVSVVNFSPARIQTILFSKVFGGVGHRGSARALGGTFMQNISSDLNFYVNGAIVVAGQNITINNKSAAVKVACEFDSLDERLNASERAALQISVPAANLNLSALLTSRKLYALERTYYNTTGNTY